MAAGVSKKLWEASDIVEMLERWELANFKPKGVPLAFCGSAGRSIQSMVLKRKRMPSVN
jgi:hypothetical protein